MLCPQCGGENDPDLRFCESCGTHLPRVCIGCGRDLKPQAKFCGHCGASQSQGAPEPVPPSSPSPAPPAAGERRQLTILFVDLVGSTAASTRLDPEEWSELLAGYHRATAQVVRRFGGSVAKFLGDGVLALFGYPQANEDDAARAVRSALAIVETVTSLKTSSLPHPARRAGGESGAQPLSVRVGIHTGLSVIADLDDRPDVFGEAPNIAARVQEAAAPGTVMISETTQRLVAGLFIVEPRGAQTLKGLSAPMALYRVVRPSGMRSRLEVAGGRLTPFVGRREEIDTLAHRWQRALAGEGQSILISGEAGVGKSRLLHELRRLVGDTEHTWLECGATPYTQATPFHPVTQLVTQALGLQPDEAPEAKLGRIERGLGELATPESIALLADFLSVAPPAPLSMSAEAQRRKTISLLAQWTLSLARDKPHILVVEDLHWCDASSLVLLNQLALRGTSSRLLLVATTRPGPWPSWARRTTSTALTLTRLTGDQAREMITTLGGQTLAAATLEALVARADGVPLFVEELTKSITDPGAQTGVEAIPATLADSLMARLDRLSSAKEVAQRASVLGREFSWSLLTAVVEMDEAMLREGLAHLIDAEILFGGGDSAQASYIFKHALVQEAAYGSLLKRTRQQLHGRVVAALLGHREAGIGVAPELIARHAEAAAQIAQAIAAYQEAGETAQARFAHEEAIDHLRRAVKLLDTQDPTPQRDEREAAVQLALGASLTAAVGFAHIDAGLAFERALALFETSGQARAQGFALSGLATYLHNCGQLRRADALATRLQLLAQETGDDDLTLLGHRCLSVIRYYQGQFASALEHGEQNIALYRPGHHEAVTTVLGDPRTTAMASNALNLVVLGWPDRALARAREAIDLARRIEHPFSIAHAMFYETNLHGTRRDLVSLRARAAESMVLAEAQGFPSWMVLARTWDAYARVAGGDPEALGELLAGGMLLLGADGDGPPPPVSMMVADGCLLAGLYDEARKAVETGWRLSASRGHTQGDAEFHRIAAELLLHDGAPPQTVALSLERAIDVARAQQARLFELRAATALSRLWIRESREADARSVLEPVYTWFTEGLDLADLVAARSLLASL